VRDGWRQLAGGENTLEEEEEEASRSASQRLRRDSPSLSPSDLCSGEDALGEQALDSGLRGGTTHLGVLLLPTCSSRVLCLGELILARRESHSNRPGGVAERGRRSGFTSALLGVGIIVLLACQFGFTAGDLSLGEVPPVLCFLFGVAVFFAATPLPFFIMFTVALMCRDLR